jgi:NAD-dependent dihydropyrimidine dehydrogenase PreA subunit
MDCIRMDENAEKAVIRYPEECMLCGWCVVVCPQDAVYVSPHKSSPLIVSWG